MKVKYILNNAMMGGKFRSLPQDYLISKTRIDPYHTEVVFDFVNQKQLDNVNRMLFGSYSKGRYEILDEGLKKQMEVSEVARLPQYHWFGKVDDFVDPLIEYLQPKEGETVKQRYDSNGGRVKPWLGFVYGRENILKFVEVCDKYGFDEIITEIYLKHIKTFGRFEQYLNNKLGLQNNDSSDDDGDN